jgi:hypothetical protein
MQGFRLGTQLRHTYISATGLQSVPLNKITVQSTDYDRTVDTARALLFGLLSPDQLAGQSRKSLGVPPGDCKCRPDHGARSPPECVASCLGIKARIIPKVHVRSSKDAALHQTEACKGWRDHANEVKASDGWKHGPDNEFQKEWEIVQGMDGGAKYVQKKMWPGGSCAGCIDMLHSDRLDMTESVRFQHEAVLGVYFSCSTSMVSKQCICCRL